MLTQHFHTSIQLFRAHLVQSGQDDGTCISNLIDEKFTEILQIHFTFRSIYYGNGAVYLHMQVLSHILHCFQYIRKLAHTGRLDQHTVRLIGLDYLFQGSAKITYQ